MPYRYSDPFVKHLYEDIGALIVKKSPISDAEREDIQNRLGELGTKNQKNLEHYQARTKKGQGIPDTAFKQSTMYFFPDTKPVKTFATSGTSQGPRGQVDYSPLGLELMNLSIITNAKRHMIGNLQNPAIIRFVPKAIDAPQMIMAYGMECIGNAFGHPDLSASVVGQNGVDYAALDRLLTLALNDNIPVILIGASFSYVNICDHLLQHGKQWLLPPGSRAFDAGGFKTASRVVTVAELRKMINDSFGIVSSNIKNLFGMTELASQLYDAIDLPIGPLGERPKIAHEFIHARLRDPQTMEFADRDKGLLEVADLCILDRPNTILTGDVAIGSEHGVAIVGRAARGESRGCSLSLDKITTKESSRE